MYKRPIPRVNGRVPMNFVSKVGPGGAIVSQWQPAAGFAPVPTGHPSRVGEIIDKMRRGADCVRRPSKQPWRPPLSYEWYADMMYTGDAKEAFLQRCREWHAANPPVHVEKPAPPVIDPEPILKLFAKYAKRGDPFEGGTTGQPIRPPIEKMKVAWELAGYPPERIAKAVAHFQHLEDTSEERQKALDEIFAKYPSASKPTPKPKKVIKAVKKKMH